MKEKIKTFVILFMIIISIACSKDSDNNELNFSEKFLKQTQWKGVLHETDKWGKGEYVVDIGLVFYTENKGKCSTKRGETPPFEYDFDYSINGYMLYISEMKGDIDGYWLLIQFDDNLIVLEKGTGGDGAYKGVLTLTRKI